MPACNQCKKPEASNSCICGAVSYCGAECQKKDWKKHKANCPPFSVQVIPGKGKGLIAVRKINFGEKILQEKPLLVIDNNKSDNYDDWCDYVTQQIDGLKEDELVVYNNLADNETFKKTSELLYIKFKKDYSEEKLKYLRILRTNGVNTDDEGRQTCVFPKFSLLNHSCAPNAMRNVEDEEDGVEVTVTAARDITKGEEITIKYFSQEIASMTRDKRRVKLLNWGFQCSCQICNLEGDDLEKNEQVREKLEAVKEELKKCPTDANDIKSLLKQRKLEICIISLLRELRTQLIAEMPDHLMACHHVLQLLIVHRQKVTENPDAFRQEALGLASKLGSKFITEFEFWDKLTNKTLNAFKTRRRK